MAANIRISGLDVLISMEPFTIFVDSEWKTVTTNGRFGMEEDNPEHAYERNNVRDDIGAKVFQSNDFGLSVIA